MKDIPLSQQKAVAAVESGRFKDEIIPIVVKDRKGETIIDTDEGPRKDTSLEKLSKLKNGIESDLKSRDEIIKDLKRLNNDLAEKAYNVPADRENENA